MSLVRFLLAAFLALTLSGSASAQSAPVALSPQELRAAAVTLLEQGNAAQALRFARALLQRDSTDLAALLIGAEAAIALDDPATARALAARAWPLATTPDTRFRAARLAALALSLEGRDTTAQLWLRRAFQDAPSEDARRSAAEDYRFLRARNPLRFQLSGGLRPSSNINGGSSEDTQAQAWLGGIPLAISEASRALAGWELSGDIDLSYRLRETTKSQTSFLLDASFHLFWFTPSTSQRVPDLSASNFNRQEITTGIRHSIISERSSAPMSMTATVGRRWFGGEVYSTSQNLSAVIPYDVSDTTTVSLSLAAGRAHYPGSSNGITHTRAIGLGYQRRVNDSVRLDAGFTGTTSRSQSATRDFNSYRAVIGAQFDSFLSSVDIGISSSLEFRDYTRDFAIFVPNKREDRIKSLSISTTIPNLEFYGFRPVLTTQFTDTRSTINTFSSRTLSTGLTFRSSF